MNNNWKEVLHFSQRERRGIFIFVAVIGIFLYIPSIFEKCFLPQEVDFSNFKLAIAEYEAELLSSSNIASSNLPPPSLFNPNTASLEDLMALSIDKPIAQRIINYRKAGGYFYRKEDLAKIYGLDDLLYKRIQEYIDIPPTKKLKKKIYFAKKTPAIKPLQPFKFDPNDVNLQELIAMGLPSKLAQQLINYRSKGGSFKKKEDLKKLYALSSQHYQQLAPFIIFKKSSISTSPPSYNTPPMEVSHQNIRIGINTATIEEWQQLNGIGPFYAKKIVRFREKLGGFTTIAQVGTTYGLPDSVFQKINAQLRISPTTPTLRVNTISVDQLKAHPYIKKHQAIAIVNYRKNHGAFDSIEKFKKVKVFSEKDLERVAPYLSFK